MDASIKSVTGRNIILFSLLSVTLSLFSEPLIAATEWQKPLLSAQQHAVQTQQKIDAIDESNQINLQRYQLLNDEIRQLEKQLKDKRHLLTKQEQQLKDIQQQRRVLQNVEIDLYPLLKEMLDAYATLVDSEPQFLPLERENRRALLQKNFNENSLTLHEQYRALLTAYQIEGNYNQMLLSWLGNITQSETTLAVQFLAVGRVALYYLTLDGKQGGIWLKQHWHPLTKQQREQIKQGIAIAQHQQPEQVIALPLLQGEHP